MSKPSNATGWAQPIIVADLKPSARREILIEPDANQRREIAVTLGVPEIRKLKFSGELSPLAEDGWQLTAQLGATVIQDCVVSLDPVTTRIEEPVCRQYLTELPPLEPNAEIEMPEDDTLELISDEIDPTAVMIEALNLALPQFPRADGASLAQSQFTAPGQIPMSDDQARPFASLETLRKQLKNDTE